MWYIGKSPAVFLFNYPIFNISYYEAEAFANFSNARLPTEEEWDWIASNRNKTSTPYGTCLPNVYSIICDINEKELINFTSSESLMKVNMLYGNVWEFLRSDNDRIVHCKGGDNVTPNFIMNNDLVFKIQKESRLYSVGIRLIY
jgi:formylglycine-generating enzyme required for sulfatase activity